MSALVKSLLGLTLTLAMGGCTPAPTAADIQISGGGGRLSLMLACSDDADDAACMALADTDLEAEDLAGAFGAVRLSCDRGHAQSCTRLMQIAAAQPDLLREPERRDAIRPHSSAGCARNEVTACWLVGTSLFIEENNPMSIAPFFEAACRLGDRSACDIQAALLLSAPVNDPAGRGGGRLQQSCGRLSADACIAISSHRLWDITLEPRPEDSPRAHFLACAFGSGDGCSEAGYWLENQSHSIDMAREFYAAGCSRDSGVACYNEAIFMPPGSDRLVRFQEACSLGFAKACTKLL